MPSAPLPTGPTDCALSLTQAGILTLHGAKLAASALPRPTLDEITRLAASYAEYPLTPTSSRLVKERGDRGARHDGRSTRWAGEHQRRRAQFVEAALVAIARHGPETSTEQIAQQAGVARTRLYKHFTDAADLTGRSPTGWRR